MSRFKLVLVLTVFGLGSLVGGSITAIPVTVVKGIDGYVIPDDPSLIDSTKIEHDWLGEVQVNWLSYTYFGLGVVCIASATVIAFRSSKNARCKP